MKRKIYLDGRDSNIDILLLFLSFSISTFFQKWIYTSWLWLKTTSPESLTSSQTIIDISYSTKIPIIRYFKIKIFKTPKHNKI